MATLGARTQAPGTITKNIVNPETVLGLKESPWYRPQLMTTFKPCAFVMFGYVMGDHLLLHSSTDHTNTVKKLF